MLTVVGELHSLTDWHVSDASEEAELEDFYKKNRQHFIFQLTSGKTLSILFSCAQK